MVGVTALEAVKQVSASTGVKSAFLFVERFLFAEKAEIGVFAILGQAETQGRSPPTALEAGGLRGRIPGMCGQQTLSGAPLKSLFGHALTNQPELLVTVAVAHHLTSAAAASRLAETFRITALPVLPWTASRFRAFARPLASFLYPTTLQPRLASASILPSCREDGSRS